MPAASRQTCCVTATFALLDDDVVVARPDPRASRLHRALPGYQESPLQALDDLAAELGIGALYLKDERNRFGLPAFKILGASWAVWRRLCDHLGITPQPDEGWAPLRRALAGRDITLVAATEGNHGRAVARIAGDLGIDAEIYVPRDMSQSRRAAIAGEGARIRTVDGDYDEAVGTARSAAAADGRLLIADVADTPGGVAAWVIDGYATLFEELESGAAASARFDVLFVPAGVGALAAAAVRHFRTFRPEARVVAVEPVTAACVLASVRAGRVVSLPAVKGSIMAGLNCGTASAAAWGALVALDAVVAVHDDRAVQSARMLDRAGLTFGATGAAALAGLVEVLRGEHAAVLRAALQITAASSVLVIGTEGPPDPTHERVRAAAPSP